MSLTQLYLHEINKLRANPQSYVEKFQKICAELKSVKRKKRLYEELLDFVEKLKKAPPVGPLKLSPELSNVADVRIDSILKKGGFHDDDFMEISHKNASGFEEIYQIFDKYNQNPPNFLTDQLMDARDEEKTNRKLLFDPNIYYIGICDLEKAKKNNLILLVFSDDVDTEVSNEKKTKDEQILEYINIIRADTKVASPAFEEILVEARKVKASQKYLDNIQNLLEICYNSGMVGPLTINDSLCEIAKSYIKNPRNIANKKHLETQAKTLINNFNLLFGGYCSYVDDNEEIIRSMLTHEDDQISISSRNAIIGKNIKYIGIAYNAPSKTTVIVGSDKFEEGAEDPFEETFTAEFNKLRNNPKSFDKIIAQQKERKKWASVKYTNSLKNLGGEIGKHRGLKELHLNSILCDACEEYLNHADQKKGLFREEEEIMQLRLSHYCSGYKVTLMMIDQGSKKPVEVLLNMLLNERDGSGNLTTVFNEKVRYIGVFNGQIMGKTSTVAMLADDVRDLIEKPFLESFHDELNHIRIYPKSYIKVFQGLHDNPEKDSFNDNTTRIKDESLMMKYFLKSSRTFGGLNKNEFLTKACEARVAYFLKHQDAVLSCTQEDLKAFLSDYCQGYNIYEQVAVRGFVNARNFLCSAILNIYDNEKIVKKIVFSPKYYNFGIAYDEDSQLVVVVFADQANAIQTYNEPVVSRLWKKLERPIFSEDETNQLRRDFQELDTCNLGFIYPNNIVTFMDMVPDFKELNPFYYEAFQNLNTVENNKAGIQFEQFEEAVAKVIKLQTKDRWEELYEMLVKNSDSEGIDFSFLWSTMKA